MNVAFRVVQMREVHYKQKLGLQDQVLCWDQRRVSNSSKDIKEWLCNEVHVGKEPKVKRYAFRQNDAEMV